MRRHERTGQFPEDFIWGVSTASYQVEGAVSEDGRSPSIWDTFSHTPGAVAHGHTGDVACDQYHRYQEDAALMGELGIDAYRFSFAWPRILPNGTGRVNQKGVDYYKRLIEALKKHGIEPAVTLYHWDLPQVLEDEGGWPARRIADAFAEYAERCFELFPEVRRWTTLNEPFCSSILGYLTGEHAPGRRDRPAAYRAVHHLLLAHGKAIELFRRKGNEGEIGIVLNTATPRPATRRDEDLEAADRGADLMTRMFLHPVLGKGYPQRHLDAYPDVSMPIEAGDMDTIAAPIDFLGINYYFEDAVTADPAAPEGFRSVPQYQKQTEMGWPVTPEGFYRHLKWIAAETGELPLYISENGAAFPDRLSADGTACSDPERIDYLRSHLEACSRAVRDGVPLKGYYLWSFIDNFEWAFGFDRRFGIVYCDYVNQRRVMKDSFYFYRDVIAGMEPLHPRFH
jgi:beta-glucosidase